MLRNGRAKRPEGRILSFCLGRRPVVLNQSFGGRKQNLMKRNRWQKYFRLFVISALVLAIYTLVPDFPNQAYAQGEGKFLADRHQARGMNCATCHRESPPTAAVPSNVCIKCHGNAEKLAEKTSAVKPHNPHDSHIGEVACDQCHHGHKVSVNACAQCHTFGFKVP